MDRMNIYRMQGHAKTDTPKQDCSMLGPADYALEGMCACVCVWGGGGGRVC